MNQQDLKELKAKLLERELLERQRLWEQKKGWRWTYFPVEPKGRGHIWWNLAGVAICCISAGLVIGVLWAVFR